VELGGLQVSVEKPQTVLRGSIRDQAALHRIPAAAHRLGIELVEVRQLPGEILPGRDDRERGDRRDGRTR
jgi:hypothetical protein